MFTHLHVRTWYSLLAGGSSPEALVAESVRHGMSSLAVTDVDGVYGAVRFQQACRKAGIKPLLGAEVRLEGAPIVLLARSQEGYAHLCRILTEAHLRDRERPETTLEDLGRFAAGLFCLTGARESRLWALVDEGRTDQAVTRVVQLLEIFGPALSIEVAHHLLPGDGYRIEKLHRLSDLTGVPLVATGDVRYAVREDYRRYDLLTCTRLGLTIFDHHPERPKNAEACLKSEADLRALIPYPEAFERAAEIGAACQVDLLPEEITPPAARLPEGVTAREELTRLCRETLPLRYPTPAARAAAEQQFEKEMGVLADLDLEEFFLVVHEVVSEARRRGIRCAGRGSAANSIVAYLLGITGVDPIAHHLLFERFLHRGRKGTPDIDVDFDAERREEVIAWMEERFGIEQTAMTATVVSFRLRSALRDVARALGWPIDVVNKLSKAAPHRGAARAPEYRVPIEQVLGASPLTDLLIELTASLEGCPRHMGLHVGGMVLSRKPLYAFSPVQVSANGVKMVQFDKDDVEALGLVKFDVLGLRMLASVSEAVELVERHEAVALDIDHMRLDDERTFRMFRAGKTLGVFQIESQGQLHLLAKNQPETFDDLITEVALFRPGPVQGGMVPPFVRRRRGLEPVTYEHPDLAPILRDTYGVILFQEQILEIAHHFAGMTMEEADEFRRLMSKFRDPGEMENMRGQFVEGAVRRGVPGEVATSVFNKVANFVGYGFCRSHAAAFAKTVYQSGYLKAHHPAAYMAAVMQHRPGMYSLMTLEEEARRFGVPTLVPDIARSSIRYDLEPDASGRLAIRKPLTAVAQLSADDARTILWERLLRPFESLEDLYRRVALGRDVLRNLARAGALDELTGGDGRRALWMLGLLERRLGPAGQAPVPTLFDLPAVAPADIPDLPALTQAERLEWDLQTHDAARVHPVTLLRRSLNDLEIRPIEMCYRIGQSFRLSPGGIPPLVTVAGIAIMRQRPPTAKGVMFLTLEDETGFIQCVVRPQVMEYLDHVLRSGALIVRGQLHAFNNWRGLVVTQAWQLNGIFGGYEGHPNYQGGRDTRVQTGAPAQSAVPLLMSVS